MTDRQLIESRREEILVAATRELARRVVARRRRRAGAAAAISLLIGAALYTRLAGSPAPIAAPPSISNRPEPPAPSPVAATRRVVHDDSTILARLRVNAVSPRATPVADDELPALLRASGLPTGVIRTADEVITVFELTGSDAPDTESPGANAGLSGRVASAGADGRGM